MCGFVVLCATCSPAAPWEQPIVTCSLETAALADIHSPLPTPSPQIAQFAGTHYNETDLNRRLRVYRHNNNDDDASWFYFDQHEIIPTELNAADTVPVLLNKACVMP